MTALSCSLAYRADGAEAYFPPGTLIPTLCIIEGLPAAMYTISLPYLCFFAAITAGEAAGSKCANSTRKGLLQSGPNKSAGVKGRIEPFAPALICIRGYSAVYPPERLSPQRPLHKLLHPTAIMKKKTGKQSPRKAYSSFFSALFCGAAFLLYAAGLTGQSGAGASSSGRRTDPAQTCPDRTATCWHRTEPQTRTGSTQSAHSRRAAEAQQSKWPRCPERS